MNPRRRRVLIAVLWTVPMYFVAAVVSLLFLIVGIDSTANSWLASHRGVEGTFEPERVECRSRGTWSAGRFESTDGSVEIANALLRDDLGGCPGPPRRDPVSVSYPGQGEEVFHLDDQTWKFAWVMCLIAPVAFVAMVSATRTARDGFRHTSAKSSTDEGST